MIFDRALALACELGERDGIRRCLQAGQRNYPELGIEVRELAGGTIGYSGMSGSLSEGTAIGVECEVSQMTVNQITEFFRSHGAAPRVVVSPLTNSELAPLLARSGYIPIESQNTLVASLDAVQGERHGRIQEMADVRAWADASARGFCDGGDPSEMLLKISMLLATGGATALEVRDRDAVVSAPRMAAGDDPRTHRASERRRHAVRSSFRGAAQRFGAQFPRAGICSVIHARHLGVEELT